MAIVKLKYTRGRDAIKAHLRYIVHRPGKEREKLTRALFQHNYLSITKEYAYDLISRAPRGTVFYKMTINFHPLKEDTRKDLDLHYITSLTVREMQLRLGRSVPFIATIHDGHADTDLRHIHAICLVQGRLSKEDFAKLKTLWKVATAEVRYQRRMRDRVLERHQKRILAHAQVLYQASLLKHISLYQTHVPRKMYRGDKPRKMYRGDKPLKPLQLQLGCSNCGYGQRGGIPKWYDFCPCCHKPLKQEKTLWLERSLSL